MTQGQNRVRRGVPDGGQFTSSPHLEPDVVLERPDGAAAVLSAPPDQLDRYVTDPDVNVRAAAAWHADLTSEQAARLADPDQPFTVRAALVRSVQPGTAARAAEDPDPVIRWHALARGYDLPAAARARLAADPGVRRVADAFRVAVPA